MRGSTSEGQQAQGARAPCPLRAARNILGCLLACAVWLLLSPALAWAADPLQPITVIQDQERIEVTALGRIYQGRGDTLQVDTAPGSDGIIGRMSVRASSPGTSPNWAVFALQNATDKPVERWLTAERYTAVGSGIIWPDLDSRRIEAVTPSFGFLPERVKNDRADIFRITLDPGQTITYVAELSSDRFARIYLWKPLDYELKVRDRQLFNGIMLGITGLLAIFLTAVFAANHKAIFPSAALVGWCVLAYLCVDFGFWPKLLQLRPEDNALYRAATESAMAASFVIFLTTFLRLGSWHGFVRMLAGIWIAAQLALIAVAVIDPRLAATFARASFLLIGGVGALVTVFLAVSGQDRALALVPTWLLLVVWIFGAAVTLTGRLSGDIFVSGLVAGLVLIIVLLGFTVTQFAFRSFEPIHGTAPSELQLRSLAIDGSAAAVWEWNARRDEIKVSPSLEAALGLGRGELSAKVEDFARHLHPADRERFRLLLWSVQERNGGTIQIDLRMRHADNSYRWFDLEASSIAGGDRRALRCVGLMRDVTEARRAQERLLHNAVRDTVTGLPNRALFLDRLGMALVRAKTEQQTHPTVLFIDIDKFRSVTASLGLHVGDSLLLTIARRLARHLGPHDTVARVGTDQFALLIDARPDHRELALFAERVRRSLRSPIKMAGKEVVVTGSTGIATFDGTQTNAEILLREAEIAMYRAKRGGADRVEIFRPEMRSEPDERAQLEGELRKALERKQIRVLYQPIIHLHTEELAGFEALARWEHPRQGIVDPLDLLRESDATELVVKLGSYVLSRALQQVAQWQTELPRAGKPVFVSINLSSQGFLQQDNIQELRALMSRAALPAGSLRFEIAEPMAMENPERAVEVLGWLRSAGAGIALDDFGTGCSSLAYLQRFPFDTVKVDQGLVQASAGDGPGAAIVRSIVALARELGKKVLADGVEGAEDASFLRSLGCDLAQGAYYGEPMAEREAIQLLRTIRKSERKLHRTGFLRTKVPRRQKSKARPATASARATASAADAASAPGASRPPPLATGSARAEAPPAPRSGTAPTAALPGAATSPARPESEAHPSKPKAGMQLLSRLMRSRRKAGAAAGNAGEASGAGTAGDKPSQPSRGRQSAKAAQDPSRTSPAQSDVVQGTAAPLRSASDRPTASPRQATPAAAPAHPSLPPPRHGAASIVPMPSSAGQPMVPSAGVANRPPEPAPSLPAVGAPPRPHPPAGSSQPALPRPPAHQPTPAPPLRNGPPPPPAANTPRPPAARSPSSSAGPAPPSPSKVGAGAVPLKPAAPAGEPAPAGGPTSPPAAAPDTRTEPQFPALPPAIQQSLSRLAGVPIEQFRPPAQVPRGPAPGPAQERGEQEARAKRAKSSIT